MFLREIGSRIHRSVGPVADYTTIGLLLWAAMTWLSSNVPFIFQYGWSGAILAGFLLVCILMLAMGTAGAGLAGWRYFYPLTPASGAAVTTFGPDIAGNVIAKMDDFDWRLNELSERVTALPTTYTPLPDPSAIKKLMESHAKVSADIPLLTEYLVYNSTLYLLSELIIHAPDLPKAFVDMNERAYELAQDYVNTVRRAIVGTDRGSSLSSILISTAHDAEQQVLQMPIDERPAGVDSIIFCKWTVSHMQCIQTVSFLERQKREIEERLAGFRGNLIERLNLPNR